MRIDIGENELGLLITAHADDSELFSAGALKVIQDAVADALARSINDGILCGVPKRGRMSVDPGGVSVTHFAECANGDC